MAFDVTSFIFGGILGAFVLAAFVLPRLGRIFTRLLAVGLLIVGAGMLIWAADALYRGIELTPITWERISIAEPSQAFGLAGGLLTGGVLALLLSFTGRSSPGHSSR